MNIVKEESLGRKPWARNLDCGTGHSTGCDAMTKCEEKEKLGRAPERTRIQHVNLSDKQGGKRIVEVKEARTACLPFNTDERRGSEREKRAQLRRRPGKLLQTIGTPKAMQQWFKVHSKIKSASSPWMRRDLDADAEAVMRDCEGSKYHMQGLSAAGVIGFSSWLLSTGLACLACLQSAWLCCAVLRRIQVRCARPACACRWHFTGGRGLGSMAKRKTRSGHANALSWGVKSYANREPAGGSLAESLQVA